MQTARPEREQGVFVRQSLIACAIVTSIVLVVWFLWYTTAVLLLAFAAVLLAVVLHSLSEWISDHTRLSSGWALGIVAVALTGGLGATGWLLAPDIAVQFDQLMQQLPGALQQLRQRVAEYAWGQQLVDQMANQLQPNGGSLLTRVAGVFSTTLGALASLAIVLFVGLYLAAEPHLYTNGILRLVPRSKRLRAAEVLGALGYMLRWWLLGRICSMVVVGAFTTLGLWLLGMPLALTLGILAALLDFVPNVGPLLAAAPAILLALTQSPTEALYVAGLYGVIQIAEGYLLTPLVERQTVQLPPALTIIAQALLGVLIGGIGLVLAAPLTASVMVLIKLVYIEDILGDTLDVEGTEDAPDPPE